MAEAENPQEKEYASYELNANGIKAHIRIVDNGGFVLSYNVSLPGLGDATSAGIVHGFFANFLMVIVFPPCDTGYRVALTLDPSLSSASIRGDSMLTCLPTLLPICSASSYIASSLIILRSDLHHPNLLWKTHIPSLEELTAISSRLSSARSTSRSPRPSIMFII